MAVNYTSLLKLAQPVNGSEDGAWGTVVNDPTHPDMQFCQ